jgi:acetyltransferase-like isoleucine patch superfamily enzyme
MRFAGMSPVGRLATWLATLTSDPFYGRIGLARLTSRGFVSYRATVHHSNLRVGVHTYIDDRVLIYRDQEGGRVELGNEVHLHRDCIIQTGQGGSVVIGARTTIQPRCQFSAYKGSILIGNDVEIAPNCSFYPYNHGLEPDRPINTQPLQSKGGITVSDGAWIGVGVIVLDGSKIGKGTVVGAGSVVTGELPDGAIALGVPARAVRMRGE